MSYAFQTANTHFTPILARYEIFPMVYGLSRSNDTETMVGVSVGELTGVAV